MQSFLVMAPQDDNPPLSVLDSMRQQRTVPQVIGLHDEKLRLAESLVKLQSEYDLLNLLCAVSKPKMKDLQRKYKEMMGLRLGITQTTLESRYKRARKKFKDVRAQMLRDYQQLERETVRAASGSVEEMPHPPNSSNTAGSHESQATRRIAVGQSQDVVDLTGSDRVGFAVSVEQENILRPVDFTRVPDDNIVVDVEGEALNQRQLAQWYKATDMSEESRKLFEAKNVEINQMRRIRRRG